MNKIRTYIWMGLICCIHLGFFNTLEAAKLHAIIVADTTADDIGESTTIDSSKISKEIKKIAQYTKLSLKETVLKGRNTTAENLMKKVKNLKVSSDDVVFFYFSGHGYRTSDKEGNPWPYLFFSVKSQGLDYEKVVRAVEKHHPRLMVMIADACNNLIPDRFAPILFGKMLLKPPQSQLLKENYRHLFLNTKGSIVIVSSKAGEYSWATNRGSLFTLAFIECLQNTAKGQELPIWENILSDTATMIQNEQHPEYLMNIEY